MRSRLAACLLLVALPLTAAAAQPYLLPYAGYTVHAGYDNGASFVAERADRLDARGGITLGLGVDVGLGWDRLPFALFVRPSIEMAFVPGETVTFDGGESIDFGQRFWQAGAALVGEVPVGRSPVVPSLGFGLTYARYSADFDAAGGAEIVGPDASTSWELAPVLVAGLRYDRGRVAPLLLARYRFADPEPAFSEARPGDFLDNGLSVVVGARIAL